ncbi:MAG: acyl-CoA dehydrogenase family protein [Ilumatobacteraceae bacterium]|nr:acyl-CoA dehydrogenase family protein [Ilumatobacteraceae bacterium]
MTPDAVASEVRAWFTEAWDPELPLVEWRTRLVDSGWAVPSWSSDWYGRDLPTWADGVARSTIVASGGVHIPLGVGAGLAAPTIYEHGSDDLRSRVLRPTLTGAVSWCQLFSEPVAGSDLAGLQTTAVRDGDTWVVNGQKVWNTSADHADLAILVARTDWGVPKHAGLSYFVLDMHQPGVEARPILQMNFHRSFMEVFLTDATIAHTDLVGGEGGGWRVARATLAHERSYSVARAIDVSPTAGGRVLDEARAEAEAYLETYRWYPQRRGRAELAPERAATFGMTDDPVVRQQITDLWSYERAAQLTADRAAAARALGRPPGSEGSIGKLALSEVARRSNRVHSTISGAQGMLRDGEHPLDDVIAEVLVSTPAQSIAGGTDEIQHNIIGENVLGLPRDPSVDRDRPFRDVGRQG